MKSTFLKVMAILVLIFGIIGLIFSAMALLGAGGMTMMLGFSYPILGSVVSLIQSILMIVAGVIGMGASNDVSKAGKAVTFGIVLIVLAVISIIVGVVEMNTISAQINELFGAAGIEGVNVGGISWTTFTGLIIPILYFVAAFTFKKKAA